jgi:predicted ferric reductase
MAQSFFCLVSFYGYSTVSSAFDTISTASKSRRQRSGDVTKLTIRGVRAVRPGKVVWIQVADVSFFNWHPFTVASATRENEITVAFRALGGYTKRANMAVDTARKATGEGQKLQSLKIRVDGPYGVGHLQWGTTPSLFLLLAESG